LPGHFPWGTHPFDYLLSESKTEWKHQYKLKTDFYRVNVQTADIVQTQNLFKSLVLVFYEAPGIEIQCYCNVCCALTNQQPVVVLIVYSLCKNIIMEYSHIQKLWHGVRQNEENTKGKKGRTNEGRMPGVVENKGWCFQLRVYNDCCAGLCYFKKFEACLANNTFPPFDLHVQPIDAALI